MKLSATVEAVADVKVGIPQEAQRVAAFPDLEHGTAGGIQRVTGHIPGSSAEGP